MKYFKPRIRGRHRGSLNRGLTITKLILENIADLGVTMLDAFFPAKYPEARLWRSLLGLDTDHRFERKTFNAILHRLRKQGLVSSSRLGRQVNWRITDRGRQKLDWESRKKLRPDGVGRLVIFDIPEKMRKVRDAVRLELIAAGFVQLQKSVWYGDRPLPKEFAEFADALQLRRYLHVFSVREKAELNDYLPHRAGPRKGHLSSNRRKGQKS